MLNKLVLGLIVSFSTIIFSQPSFAAPCGPGIKSGQVKFYKNSKYRGACVALNVGRYSNTGRIGIGNDKTSSIQVGPRTQVRLCVHTNFRGRCKTYTKNWEGLGSMNDKTSSAIISLVKTSSGSCRPKANQIAVFEHVNYKGACSVLGTGSYRNSSKIGIANDTISSVLVGRNAAIEGFRDTNFRAIHFYSDKNISGISVPGDRAPRGDVISSLRVVKTR